MSNEAERRHIQDALVDPDPFVEEVLRNIDERTSQTIYGPDGVTPLLEPVIDDRTVTYAKGDEPFSIDPEELLMAAARMRRDGWTLPNIRAELDLIDRGPQEVTLQMLDRAITNVGMPLLELAIKEGRQPEESKRVVGYKEPGGAAPAPSEETSEDALAVGRKVLKSWGRDA